MMFDYKNYMQLAYDQAKMALNRGEVPIGAVVVDESGKVISAGHNMVEGLCDGTAHAEMLVVNEASRKLKSNERLNGCTIYVTLEPCSMCASAIALARIARVVYGAADPKGGGVEYGAKIFSHSQTNFKPEIIGGVMEEECKKLLQDFFKTLR